MQNYLVLEKEASQLARRLFGDDGKKRASFTERLLDVCYRAQNKDFLIIHNPGGWGNTPLEHSQQWERSIVEGVCNTIERLGYTWILKQYFRSGTGWQEIMRDMKEQSCFFASKARIMAAELQFITWHLNTLRVIMLGISQGAAFSNAVLQYLSELDHLCSVEVGMPVFHKSRRVVTGETLAVDSNGLMPDAMMGWDMLTMVKAFGAAPFRWIKYRAQGKRVKFGYCINFPGHEYNWEYPEVRGQIEDFLNFKYGTKSNTEVGVT